VHFSGILDGWSMTAPFEWTLSLSVDDFVLRNGFIARHPITRSEWPSCHEDAIGNYMPIVYGTHDSSGVNALGMIPAYYVDTTGFRYLLSLGNLKNVKNVYLTNSDGTVSLVSTGAYSVARPIIGGKQVTLIDFTSQQTGEISADVDGYSTVADGSGTLITNPCDQVKHALVNFVWNDYRSGAWFSDSTAPIDTAQFSTTAAWLTTQGYEGSFWTGGAATDRLAAKQMLNEWLDGHPVRGFWTNAGKLAVVPIRHDIIDAPPTWFNADADGAEIIIDTDTRDVIRHIETSYLYSAHKDEFLASLTVSDLSITETSTRQLNLPWSAARGT
jgi:hypothetical protein